MLQDDMDDEGDDNMDGWLLSAETSFNRPFVLKEPSQGTLFGRSTRMTPTKPSRAALSFSSFSTPPIVLSPPTASSSSSSTGSPLTSSVGSVVDLPEIMGEPNGGLVGLGFGVPLSIFAASPERSCGDLDAADKRLKRKGEAVLDAPRLPSRAVFDVPSCGGLRMGAEKKIGSPAVQRIGMMRRPRLQRARVNVFERRFECVGKLGAGNGGVVWKVKDREGEAESAVKISTIFSGLRDRFVLPFSFCLSFFQ